MRKAERFLPTDGAHHTAVQPELPGLARSRFALLALAVVMSLLACGRTSSDDPAPIDASLARDLTLAGTATGSAQAVFGDTTAVSPPPSSGAARPPESSRDVAPTPAPLPAKRPVSGPARAPERTTRADAPRVPPTEPEAVRATGAVAEATGSASSGSAGSASAGSAVGANGAGVLRTMLLNRGTALVGVTGAKICTVSNRPGDRVVMRLREPVTAANGELLAAGTPVLLELAPGNDSTLVFRAKAVSRDGVLLPIVASAAVESELDGARIAGGSDKKAVIGGAVAGAVLGQILGKDTKGTVVGAAGGAAAGAVLARRGDRSEQCLPAGGTVRVVLMEPLYSSETGR